MMEDAVARLLRDGRLEAVEPDPPAAATTLEEARRHLESAARIETTDPNGAYALLYDAARKAVAAHMLASGYRARNRPGAHEAIAHYAEAVLAGGRFARDVGELDRMRRNRHRSEYGVRAFGRAEVAKDLDHARGIVAAAEGRWPRSHSA
jgi:hypothetical protein